MTTDKVKVAIDAYPSLSMSNILKATEKLDSGMLSSVIKNIYLWRKKVLAIKNEVKLYEMTRKIYISEYNSWHAITHSLKDTRPSLFTSKSMKNCEGEQRNSPGNLSPLRDPSLTMFDSDGGNTGTMARIKSPGVIRVSPRLFFTDAKYSNTFKQNKV